MADKQTPETIYFYGQNNAHGYMSNFSAHAVTIDGKIWPTTEHYFQAQKFPSAEYQEKIQAASTPSMAKKLGQSRSVVMRSDWEQVKEDVMTKALLAKFTQHPALGQALLSTGDARLVENAPSDYYWGIGRGGSGKNRLGHCLETVRDTIKQATCD